MKKNREQYIIEKATEADVAAIMEHQKRAVLETELYVQYPDELASEEEEQRKRIRSNIQNPQGLMLIVRDGKNIVGFASLTPLDLYYRLSHRVTFGISLEKAYWNQGIGTELIHRCIDFAETSGIERIELEVHSINERAIAIYRKEGFTESFRDDRALKNRDGSYYGLIHMRREIFQ